MPNWLRLEKHPGPFLSARMMLMKAGVREKMANLKALWRFLQHAQVSGTLRVSITGQVSTKRMAERGFRMPTCLRGKRSSQLLSSK